MYKHWGGGTNRVKLHPVFIFKDPAKELRSAGPDLHICQLKGPLGENCTPHPLPQLSNDWKSCSHWTLVIRGLMTKDTLRHLFNTLPFSFSGFLFFAIKQKQKGTSILGGDTRQSMVSALCRMNERMWDEMKKWRQFCQRTLKE